MRAVNRSITREGGVGPDLISPVSVSTRRNDAVTAEALRLGVYPGQPSRTLADGAPQLDPNDYAPLKAYTGQMQHWAGANLVGAPMYSTAPDNMRRLGLREMFDQSGEFAHQRFLMSMPPLLQQTMMAKAERKFGYR